MAGSLNRVMLIGRLGRDPEMRYLQSGEAITTFSIATDRRWTGPDGQPRDETTWHRIVAWRKLGEQCNEFLSKGRLVYIEGRLQTRSWDGPDGQKRYMTEVVADRMVLLESRPRTEPAGPAGLDDDRPGEDTINLDEAPF